MGLGVRKVWLPGVKPAGPMFPFVIQTTARGLLRMRVGWSHWLGSHMLRISTVGLRRHLCMSHWDLAHLGCHWVRVGQGRAAAGLRGRESRHGSSLVRVELRPHVMAASGLAGLTETGSRRERYRALMAGLRMTTATATLMVETTAARTTSHMVAHVAVR